MKDCLSRVKLSLSMEVLLRSTELYTKSFKLEIITRVLWDERGKRRGSRLKRRSGTGVGIGRGRREIGGISAERLRARGHGGRLRHWDNDLHPLLTRRKAVRFGRR
jgi:hypothetical protein